MASRRLAALLALAAWAIPLQTVWAQSAPLFPGRSAANESLAFERRAVEAALWAMPLVSVDAMREAYFRDGGARYNDFLFWSRPSDQLNQVLTPNSTSNYVYANVNVKDGPVVFEVPASDRLVMYGNLHGAWQVPVEDFGPAGIDKGRGGKFLLTAPDYSGPVPEGMHRIALPSVNGYFLLRPSARSADRRDRAGLATFVQGLRLYRLADAASPPKQRLIDMSGKPFDALAVMDDTFYDRLARILDEEAANPRDAAMLGMLRTIGIERGRPFAPTAEQRAALSRAAGQAKAELIDLVVNSRTPWWPQSQWATSTGLLELGRDGFTFERDGALLSDERARAFFFAFALPRHLGAATFYLTQAKDASGEALSGDRSYTLHIPAGVPARDFWALNVYDLETSGPLRGAKSMGVDSSQRNLVVNRDGSVDIVFSALPPKGGATNWVALVPGRRWTAMFRFYGPAPALLDRSWRLPDIAPQQPVPEK